MRNLTVPFALLLGLSAMPALAQVHIGIELGLPVAPRLELVAPGIQVVAGFQEEVFLQGGWYWCRRPDGWYRSRSPRAHFDWVEGRRVPRGLVGLPEGHYRNWHAEGRPGGREEGHDHGRHEGRREERRRDEGHRDEHEGHREH